MTNEEIKARIIKKEQDILKIEKRIAKWTTGMNDEAKNIAKNSSYQDYKLYAQQHQYDATVYNQVDWNKGPELSEARQAYMDLEEANKTLRKYKAQITEKESFENTEKVEVIWNFLQNWKVKANEFFHRNAQEYSKLLANEDKAYEEYLETLSEREQEQAKDYRFRYGFKKRYYSDIHSLTRDLYKWNGQLDEERLEKTLNKEVEAKYKSLVERISEKAGAIQNASYLYIACNGEINGIVQGTLNKVRVETITAGGYNIQILHYRVLVNVIR